MILMFQAHHIPGREVTDKAQASHEEDCELGQAERDATVILRRILKTYDRNVVPNSKGVSVEVDLLSSN